LLYPKTTLSGKVVTDTPYLARCARESNKTPPNRDFEGKRFCFDAFPLG